jgi:hypothetical protein
MRMRTSLASAATLMVGALFGWLAAADQQSFNGKAAAASEATSPGVQATQADTKKEPLGGGQPTKDGKKPNILVIMGDDIGWNNPSCYHRGDMG